MKKLCHHYQAGSHAPSPARLGSFYFALIILFSLVEIGGAQTSTTTNATLDPSDERAVNSIFQQWRISETKLWNISGVLCSGSAIDGSTGVNDISNPGIRCDCSFNSDTTCRITGLRVFQGDVIGPLPSELWNLTFLTILDLNANYLTGPLPTSIGNLTRMQYFAIGANALSGEIPRELGMLTDLRTLFLNMNNFSGPLPSELGSLTRLTQLFIDSAGVSGPFPQSFSNLTRMELMWASDNELTGLIPDFIGRWLNLADLRFQGNSFQGPIPPSFSNLTSLKELRITELSNGNSSLDFLRNMTSLITLILRNNNISGSVPSDLGNYQSLSLLDLSFNNLTGCIPNSLFSLSSLNYLFLGNNKLTCTLPPVKSPSLLNIDLSYNTLSGGFPSWAAEPNLQLNLVANNLTLENSNGSALSSGLNCLQRNFPCGRGSPIYPRFSIKCGGSQILSSDQTLYESDSETLGPATYYTTNSNRWAVSNVGLPFSGNNIPQYRSFSSSQFTNTSDPELFQTARISAGSLRYYGLGLENGNYNVRLQFAESEIVGTMTWRSVGRRVFDVYVQGKLVLKDFDIRKEAGGTALRAVAREFTAQVAENYLEIHLFWAGKGTCCIPHHGVYGPSISAISATPDFVPTVRNSPPSGKKNKTTMIVGIVAAVGAVCFLSILATYYFAQRRMKNQYKDEDEKGIKIPSVESLQYDLNAIMLATNYFSIGNKIGEGGFGSVYKGTFSNGQEIAVKRLSKHSGQGTKEFENEVVLVAKLQHRNLVRLLGFCLEAEEKILVYEFVPNKSLDYFLFDVEKRRMLSWSKRYEIIGGIARGLVYLHEDSRLRIIHRDLKASNILLDGDMKPKISDFGMAKIFGVDQSQENTRRIVGTYGYMSPEYAMHGIFSAKSDVFSFGVLVLEIISGRKNNGFYESDGAEDLISHAWNLWRDNRPLELMDLTIQNNYSRNEVIQCIQIGLLCVQDDVDDRPNMHSIFLELNSFSTTIAVPRRPAFFPASRTHRLRKAQNSDKSTLASATFSTNEASISEVYPR